MERKIAEARRQAELQVLDELTPEQRGEALELVGDFFDYRSPTVASQIIREGRKDARMR